MFITFDVSKPDKSNDDNNSHSANMCLMFVTFDVLKLDKSNPVKP